VAQSYTKDGDRVLHAHMLQMGPADELRVEGYGNGGKGLVG
jgi:hypothetical protein